MDPDKKKSFQSLRELIKSKIKDSYHAYLENLLGLGDGEVCDSKSVFFFLFFFFFFSFLKNSKQDEHSTPPLKDDDKVITDTVGKSKTHNNSSPFSQSGESSG